MKRIGTVEDFSKAEAMVSKRSKPGLIDPLEDPSLDIGEKHRLASLWAMVQQNRQNHSRMMELVRPMITGENVMSAPIPEKSAMPLTSGLQMACLYGDLNLVKMLVSRGEDIDQVTMSPDNFGRGRCPMSVAAELGHNAILRFLISAGGDCKNIHDPPLRQAVHRNDLEAVSMLVKGGADPNPTLHQLLCPNCDLNTIKMLLEAGAQPWGTMLLTALWRGCGERVIRLLLDYGAPFRSDLENESALEVAICRGADRPIVEVLLSASAKWSPQRHSVFPRSFRVRAKTFALCNLRLVHRLPARLVERVVFWVAAAEKRQGDHADLRRSLCNMCDLPALEHRVAAAGMRDVALQSERSGNTSKSALLESLTTAQLVSLLWQRDGPSVVKPPVTLYRTEGTVRVPRMDEGRSTPDSDHSSADEKPSVPAPAKRKRKLVSASAPKIYISSEGSAVGSFMPQQSVASTASSNARRAVHPVADSRNPNSPKPHHCSCCHVCHVSMKQRPRPIAACSNCNTIICKLCLQDRWKTDQWEEACATSNWVCHKCRGICVCKACKSKGARNQQEKQDIYV